MARPPKYKTPKAAAEVYVYNKLDGPEGSHFKSVLYLATQPCHVCSAKPMELMHVKRKDGEHKLWYNRIKDGKTICKLCLALIKVATVTEIRSYAARILAKRKHELDTKWVNDSPEKPQDE